MISKEQVNTFIDEGVVLLDHLLPMPVIDAAREDMDRQYAPHTDRETGIIGYPTGPGLEAVYQHENLERVARAVLGCESVAFLSSALLHTLPNARSWDYNADTEHVDIQFNEPEWTELPRRILFTFMIFLDGVDSRRAPTLVRPRSHRMIAQHLGNKEAFRDNPVNLRDLPDLPWQDPIPLTGRRGQVAVSTTATVHAGSLNASDKPRKVMFVAMGPAGLGIRFNMNRVGTRLGFMRSMRQRFRPDRRHLVESTIEELETWVGPAWAQGA